MDFGIHLVRTPEKPLKKSLKGNGGEIKKKSWTLWSFQFRNTLGLWYQEIEKVKPNKVLVFCSEGRGARDPIGERKLCDYYMPVNEAGPKKIPIEIQIPHPMRKGAKGSAFIVKNIIYPVEYKAIPIEWLKDAKWQTAPLPTRPEYLIKFGQGQPIRKFRVILELQYPYLAEVGRHAKFVC